MHEASLSQRPLIVVIEDDTASADALQLILEDWGAEVVVADSAQRAALQLGPRAGGVDRIITDFNLGEGPDGVAGLGPLRAAAPAAPVLVLSGSFRGRAAEVARAAGYDSMGKPATVDAIVAWLERG